MEEWNGMNNTNCWINECKQFHMGFMKRCIRVAVVIVVACIMVCNLDRSTDGFKILFFLEGKAEEAYFGEFIDGHVEDKNIRSIVDIMNEETKKTEEEIDGFIENARAILASIEKNGERDIELRESLKEELMTMIPEWRPVENIKFDRYDIEYNAKSFPVYSAPSFDSYYFSTNEEFDNNREKHLMYPYNNIQIAGHIGEWLLVRFNEDKNKEEDIINERCHIGYVFETANNIDEIIPILDFSPQYAYIEWIKEKQCLFIDGHDNFVLNKYGTKPYVEAAVLGRIQTQMFGDGFYVEVKRYDGKISRGIVRPEFVKFYWKKRKDEMKEFEF